MTAASARTPKQEAQQLIDELPDNATWQELAYRLEVRADIEEGLTDIKAGHVTEVKDVRREFNLPE
jgi:hypothetical protein